MDFSSAIEIVSSVLSKIGSSINKANYDGLIVKRLESSNTLDDGRRTNQTHVAITGEQMDIFPYMRADGYFNGDYNEKDDDLKKYYVAQIPVMIHKENITYIDHGTNIISSAEKKVYSSIVRSRRKDAADQIQMSMTNMDSIEFVELRKIVHAGTFMILLKRLGMLAYDIYYVKQDDIWAGEYSLDELNNHFYKLPTNTEVKIDDLFANNKEEIYENEYERAARVILDHINESGFQYKYSNNEIDDEYEWFRSRYSPEKLQELHGIELLRAMFYSDDNNNDSMCYNLEFRTPCREMFGSIAGGSAFKFGLFYHQDKETWITGSPKFPKELSEVEAIEVGEQIRNALIRGANIIENSSLETAEDYDSLDDKLNKEIGKYAFIGWIQKYFQMIYPDKIVNWYTRELHQHILYSLGIKPSDKYYGSNGQVAIIRRYTGLANPVFGSAFYDKFGDVKKFVRVGSTIDNSNLAKDWKAKEIVAIGWHDTGSLDDYNQGGKFNKQALSDFLADRYYDGNTALASRKSGEMQTFYTSDNNSVFLVMDGENSLALVDDIGDYSFNAADTKSAHIKPGKWHCCFNSEEELPDKTEGKLTTCVEIKNKDNLLYLYRKYYYELDNVEDTEMKIEKPYSEPNYYTGITQPYPANRIVFGAPGTGKSYLLEQQRTEVLKNGGTYERVTFHPDYTYSQFVGAYKPVTEGEEIKYKFVPGPFMRLYVKAIENGKTGNPKPHILLIEEINRAEVAAVFGDIFQLLDRDKDNVSEYPIQATEDVRGYLARELGGKPENYDYIKIPDNMLIWATMNSADQGVFPMDTAFKRRWYFTYLGIDNGEEKIAGKTVVLGKGQYQKTVEWNKLRKAINDVLLNDCKVEEDKLMGPFFIANKNLPEGNVIDPVRFKEIFKNKVLMYLFEDAAKQKRSTLFDGCSKKNLYSSICEEFDEKGVDIFSKTIRDQFSIPFLEDTEK